jgi:hypothetical protein
VSADEGRRLEMDVEKRILIVDVPPDATADQAESLLNAPYESGYYLDKLTFGWDGVGARAFYRLHVKPEKG